MAWDDDKSTAADPDNPTADEQLSADEWDAHVADQKGHASRHETNATDELGRFGNYKLLDPSDDPQTVIDNFRTSVGVGTIVLKPGNHTFDNVTIPGGITLKGPAPDETNSNVTVKPSGNNPVMICDTSTGSNLARVMDVHVDTSDIAGYSSAALTYRSGFAHLPVFIRCNVSMTQGEGTGIRWHDSGGTGIVETSANGCRIDGGSIGVHYDATFGSGAFVNGVDLRNCYIRDSTTHIKLSGPGETSANKLDVKHQVTANTNRILETTADADARFECDFASFDLTNSPNSILIDLQHDLPRGFKIRFSDRNSPAGIREATRATNLEALQFDIETSQSWLPGGTSLPYWLTSTGTGSVTHNTNNITTITTGTTASDEMAIDTGGTRLLQEPQIAVPFMTWEENVLDTTQTLTKTGFEDPSSSFEATFVADPTDSLGTGITTNYIWRVVDSSGVVETETDTGVAFGGSIVPQIAAIDGGSQIYGILDGSIISTVTMTNPQGEYSPVWSVQTQEAAAKSLRVQRNVQLRYVSQLQS